MSFPRYERYKDSGVEWLGEVPEGWLVSKIGYLAKKIGSGKTPLGGAEVYADVGVLFIRSQNVYDDGLRLDDVVFIDEDVHAGMISSEVNPGDILLNITGASIGRSCLVPNDFKRANVNQHVCLIRLIERDSTEFVSYFLKSDIAKKLIDFSQSGAAREGLNYGHISGFSIAIPTIIEQKIISGFLNTETSKIDTLISEQQKLIDLLKC